ncbi:DUF397 domain-containing protein [Micromonospora sp. NEAU-HG-1]|nr:DUF397 domain-containing protein [Micromonospora rubida]
MKRLAQEAPPASGESSKGPTQGSDGQCVEVRDRVALVDERDSKAPAAGGC